LPESGHSEVINFKGFFILFVLSNRIINEFDHSHLSLIIVSAAKVGYAGKATRQIFESRSNLVVQTLHGISVKKSFTDELVSVNVSNFSLVNQALNQRPHLLALSMGGSDTVVLDELSSQVSEQGLSVFGVTSKLADVLLVSHFSFVDLKYKITNYKLI
jgi:hypothetical protein